MKIITGIKALSIRQPWAALIVNGYKDIENRDWGGKPTYRGPLLIHASKTFDFDAVGAANSIIWDMDRNTYDDPLLRGGVSENPADYQRGGFIGLCRLNDVVEYDSSPWFFGPLGFKLRMPKPIEFIPYPGKLGLWDVPDEVIRKIKPKEEL